MGSALIKKIKHVEKIVSDPLAHHGVPEEELDAEDRGILQDFKAAGPKPITEKERFCVLRHSGFKRWSQAVEFISGPREWMGLDVYAAAERVQSAILWARQEEVQTLLKMDRVPRKYLKHRLYELTKGEE